MGELIKPSGTTITAYLSPSYTISTTGSYTISNININGIGYATYNGSGQNNANIRQFALSLDIVGVGPGDSGIITINCPDFAISSFNAITLSTNLPMAVGHYAYALINAGTIQIRYDIHTSCTIWCIGFGSL